MNKIYITFLYCLFASKHTNNNNRMLVILEQLIIKFVSFSLSIIIIIIFYIADFKSGKGRSNIQKRKRSNIGKVVPQWTEEIVGDRI